MAEPADPHRPTTEAGTAASSSRLLPLVYDALMALARQRMRRERPGHTLQPTALVHEAFLRLRSSGTVHWDHRGHFFAAAAEAMRRILVERARRRASAKRGSNLAPAALDLVPEGDLPADDRAGTSLDLLALDEALDRLARIDPRKESIVKLRYFAGLTIEETAEALGVSPATVKLEWAFAKAWLHRALSDGDEH